jgi:dTDP-4-dehydrorhamnose reductase
MSMKLLITGAQGQLGCELLQQSQLGAYRVQAPSEEDLDITDLEKIDRIITYHKPDLIINTAAYTQVDKAESEESLVFKINKTGCANLARICAQNQLPLVHLSTDYVFNGQKGSPYLETDPISPLGVYGRSKAAGENEIRKHLTKHIILRTSWLYGVYGQNFVKTMLNLASIRSKIQVVADQYGSPTNTADLARTILTISDRLHSGFNIDWGTYHYCGQGVISWHTFAKKIMDFARLHGDIQTAQIEPVTTADFPTQAQRPIYSALDCSRIRKHFEIIPQPWQESLEMTIHALLTTG